MSNLSVLKNSKRLLSDICITIKLIINPKQQQNEN